MVMNIIITLVAAVISGILATIITLYINHKKEIERQKKELAADIFGYRFLLNKSSGTEKFYAALNRVPIIFAGDKDVIAAYDNLWQSSKIDDPKMRDIKMNEELITFLKAICKSLKINCSDWNDSKVLNVFG
ncbi:DUF6680 family protein [Johnsonella ignava]|uniref:DUF6680 family protein n=1 Tax=Johnsonella ignava TaxID=43995 RepID=UPI0023EFC53D|nr:DUF6680 family protein [Johnsonella ignava]